MMLGQKAQVADAIMRIQKEFHSLCGELIDARGIPEGVVLQIGIWTMVGLKAERDGVDPTRALVEDALRAWEGLDFLEFAIPKGSA